MLFGKKKVKATDNVSKSAESFPKYHLCLDNGTIVAVDNGNLLTYDQNARFKGQVTISPYIRWEAITSNLDEREKIENMIKAYQSEQQNKQAEK